MSDWSSQRALISKRDYLHNNNDEACEAAIAIRTRQLKARGGTWKGETAIQRTEFHTNRKQPGPQRSGWINKGVNQRSKYVTQVHQQRTESPTVTLTWHACKYYVPELHQRYILSLRMYTLIIYLWWSLCTLYLHACQVRVTVGTRVFVVVLVLRISSHTTRRKMDRQTKGF